MNTNKNILPTEYAYNFEENLVHNIQTYYQHLLKFIQINPGNEIEEFFFNADDFPNFLAYLLAEDPMEYYDEIICLHMVNEHLHKIGIHPSDFRYCTYEEQYASTELVNQIILILETLHQYPEQLQQVFPTDAVKVGQISAMLESFGYQMIYDEQFQSYRVYPYEEAIAISMNQLKQKHYGK